jgi:DNA-binding FrmR family transcriptional regulator
MSTSRDPTAVADSPAAETVTADAPHAAHASAPSAACGCAAGEACDGEGRRAIAVDADAKTRNLKRLRRIEGQVRGLQRMVDEDRYCADILTQVASVHEALRSVGRELMRNHLKHCATAAIRSGGEAADAMYDELIDLMYRHVR